MDRSIRIDRLVFSSALLFCIVHAGVVHAEERRSETIIQGDDKPSIGSSIDDRLKPVAGTLTIELADTLDQVPIDASIDPVCQEINALAVELGHEPVQHCNEFVSDLVVGSGASAGSDSSSGTGSVSEIDDGPSDLVLLLHGFSATGGHDCSSYWQRQKDALANIGREALIIGYYDLNKNCDVDLAGEQFFFTGTPLEEIAHALRDWIVEEQSGRYIDIVTHSMGGLIVRKMLEFWGQDLLVRHVVTLGTPHAGVQAAHFNGSCLAYLQCQQMSAGSAFMQSLAHNPQSAVPTQWTLIAAKDDQVIGADTGIQMTDGNSGAPVVNRYQYSRFHKQHCGPLVWALGHGDLHGYNADKRVYECNALWQVVNSVDNPHERLMQAIE